MIKTFFDRIGLNCNNCLVLDKYQNNSCVNVDVLVKDASFRVVVESIDGISFCEEESIYGLRKVGYISNNEVTFRFFSRPSTKSIDNKHWCPLNKNVEQYFYDHSLMSDGYRILSLESLFFYRVCRIIFNNRCTEISSDEIEFFDKTFSTINFNTDIRILFECTFYKFTPLLYKLLEKKYYKSLYSEYLKFGDY